MTDITTTKKNSPSELICLAVVACFVVAVCAFTFYQSRPMKAAESRPITYAEAYSRGYSEGAEKGRELAYDDVFDNLVKRSTLLHKQYVEIWNGDQTRHANFSIILQPDSY